MSVLTVRGLAKSYNARAVVSDVSLTVRSGEVVGLLGPNGAGKTTSFYMIIGLVMSDGGTVHLDARDLTRYPMHARARLGLGYLPQEPSIFRRLTVEENILGILEAQPDVEPVEQKKRLEELLEELHVGSLRHNRGEIGRAHV